MYRGIMFDVLSINSKLEGKLTCVFKFQRVLQIGTLKGFFYPKWKMYELKIYQGVICDNNEKWSKIGVGIDWSF